MLRLLALLAGAALMGAQKCDDNLGQGSPGPVSFRVSVGKNTEPANDPSDTPWASTDGRYVVFASRAGNLAKSEPGFKEIFVKDRWTGSVENVSHLSTIVQPTVRADCENPVISGNGRYVLFETTANFSGSFVIQTTKNLYRYDREMGSFDPVSVLWPTSDILHASISEDGLFVAFESGADNIPNINPIPILTGTTHVFVADFTSGSGVPSITVVTHADGSLTTEGNNNSQRPRISADGQFVVYESRATNLAPSTTSALRHIFISATDGGMTELVSRMDAALGGAEADNHSFGATVSRDGRYVAFAFQGGNLAPATSLPNAQFPILRRDRNLPSPSNLVIARDIFLFGFTTFDGIQPTMSDDGRFVAYFGTNAALTDLEVNVADAQGGVITASKGIVPPGGTLLDFPKPAALSGDGRWVFWESDFETEVLGDVNGVRDIFGYGPIR